MARAMNSAAAQAGALPAASSVNGYTRNTNGMMSESATTTAGLRSLQSAAEKRLFDIVDKLRSLDINHELDLPQLVVCGSQSSGKSSVLEAISELPFPRADMTCTRIVTEIQYRRANERHLQVEIAPDKDRDPRAQQQLREAKFATQDLQQLPAMIAEAEKKLNLTGTQGFAKDVLKVQITGPDYQPITLVDLPGLIETHSQGRDYIKFVRELVDYWIEQKRSIILAVVEASRDPQTQGILTRAKELDPYGERTFGIITKPDVPEHGSQLESYWIEHAQNSADGRAEFKLKNGWHVLRNRKYSERDSSNSTRNAKEREFFQNQNENWHVVDPRYWGIESLRERLRNLLYEHTRKELPQVRRDIAAKLEGCTKELKSLDARLHKPERLWADYLRECKELQTLVKIGVDGKFNHSFFYNLEEESRHLRSRIEEANDAFYEEMTTNNRGSRLPDADNVLSNESDSFFQDVKTMLNKTRGEELPGHHDPQRLNLLFGKYTMRWNGIAQGHIERAYSYCRAFVEQMINVYLQGRLPSLPKTVSARMLDHLGKALDEKKYLAMEELEKLEADRNRSARTRNPAFTQRSERKKAEKFYLSTMRTLDSEENTHNQIGANGDRNPRVTPTYLQRSSGQEASNADAETLGMNMLIYYDIARDVFVDNVLVQVIERHLLAPLHTLFHGDFDIDQAAFYEMLSDEDRTGLEEERQRLEEKVSRLRACHAELM